MSTERLKYAEYHVPAIDPQFWFELSDRKLGTWRLEEPTIEVRGSVSSVQRTGARRQVPQTVSFNEHSFGPFESASPSDVTNNNEGSHKWYHYKHTHSNTFFATLTNYNMLEHLRQTDKWNLLQKAGASQFLCPLLDGLCSGVWKQYDGTVDDNTSRFTSSSVPLQQLREAAVEATRLCYIATFATFANLKSHEFNYVVAYPALDIKMTSECDAQQGGAVCGHSEPLAKCQALLQPVVVDGNETTTVFGRIMEVAQQTLSGEPRGINDDATPFVVIVKESTEDKKGTSVTFLPFSPHNALLPGAYVVFNDTSRLPDAPGWAARNLLGLIRLGTQLKENDSTTQVSIKLLGLRDLTPVSLGTAAAGAEPPVVSVGSSTDLPNASLVYHCTFAPIPAAADLKQMCTALKAGGVGKEGASSAGVSLRFTGWATRSVQELSLHHMKDVTAQAESASKLNIQLMKWRMLPALNLTELSSCKALLLGSGTLGCHIARNLLMWGVNHITMVDRGRVSYSNPVRQTLFVLEDAVQRRPKAEAAKDALLRILPSAHVTAVNLTIRMPGHRVDDTDMDTCRSDILQLEELIKQHDVTFLLTDSREARWLPTVIATLHNKPVINAALGFDTYLVMRHGLPAQEALFSDLHRRMIQCHKKRTGETEAVEKIEPLFRRNGCYFCNDMVAPVDSLSARTLDQQCTVTRPGVSAIASAMTVELLASLYNHPLRFLCPAYKCTDDTHTTHAHGIGNMGSATTSATLHADPWEDLTEDMPKKKKSKKSAEPEEEKDEELDAIRRDLARYNPVGVLGVIPQQIRGSVSDCKLTAMYGSAFTRCIACSPPVCQWCATVDESGEVKLNVDHIIEIIQRPKLAEELTGVAADNAAAEAAGDDLSWPSEDEED